MKRYFVLAGCLFLSSALWADPQPTPPLIPVPSNDNSLPPSIDQNQSTPVAIPSLPGTDNANTQPSPNQPQESIAPPPPVQAPAAPTDTSVPETKPAPTATPEEAVPTPTPVPAAEAQPPVEQPAQQAASSNPVSAGTLSDYFPVSEGAQWDYEYLKPKDGETAKGTFTVKCSSAKTMANGTVRAEFSKTEGTHSTPMLDSLFDNKIEKMSEGWVSSGELVFKLPAQGAPAFWSNTDKDGTLIKSKAVLGEAQVYQKTYPDCVIVTEKIVKGGKTAYTVINYYAKGIGLVSREEYSTGMKLILEKSYALVSGPGTGNN